MAWGPQSYASTPKKAPTGVNRPGYNDNQRPAFLSSMRSDQPSGPNIVVKPKPSIPQPTYNFNRGQVGGISSIPSYAKQPYYTNLEAVRNQYFDNRPDVSRDRLFRRSEQDRLYENFKQTQMKPAGNTGVIDPATGKLTGVLYQSVTPGGPTLADEAMRLANIYGPTPSEIMGDIKYGAGQIMGGIAKIPGQMLEAYQKFSPMQNIISKAMDYGSRVFNPNDLAGKLQAAGPEAQRMYAMYMSQGMPYQQAYELATGQKFAMGGIATLQ